MAKTSVSISPTQSRESQAARLKSRPEIGDHVEQDEEIATIETDKVSSSVRNLTTESFSYMCAMCLD